MMKHLRNKSQYRHKKTKAGFTLVELVVALAIAGILMAYAIPSYREFGIRQSMTNNINNLITDITFAKVTAVKHGQNVVIQAKSGTDWATGWRVYIDGNSDNAFGDPADILLRDEDIVSGLTLTGTNNFVTFDGLGSAAPSGVLGVDVIHTDAPTRTINVGLSGIISSSY